MKIRVLIAGAVLAVLATPIVAQAQGVPGGAAHGFYEGNRIAGPVGAVVGGAVGGVVGGVEGVLGVNHRYNNGQDEYAEAPPPRRLHRHRHYARHSRRIRTHRSSLQR